VTSSHSTVSKTQLTQQIKQWCLELGFVKVAILPCQAIASEESASLSQWLEKGYQAGMTWMEQYQDLRSDPSGLLDGAKSIVLVLANYAPPAGAEPHLKLARYAWGQDYHKVLKKKLKTLLKQIQAVVPEAKARYFTDSAPILEKAFAATAGLGWQGKNSLLITQDHGSWVFIGELLLNLELDPDPWLLRAQQSDHCGTCTRCLEACPTQAIVEPYVVDANRCIAYGTIEHEGPTLPALLETQLHGWVFGCDICQEVCPWNERFWQPSQILEFQPRPDLMALTPETILAWTTEMFEETMTATPLRRTGLEALQRNVKNNFSQSR
jgi:epoxyqueuosine reductase